MKKLIHLLIAGLALALSGCVEIAAKLVTPYGSVTRTAGGKTVVELDTRGFAK